MAIAPCPICNNPVWSGEEHTCLVSYEENPISPNHYQGSIEVIEYLKDKMTPEQLEGYYLGNILKYTSRYQKKNGLEDLRKAEVYLKWLINLKKTNANDYKCDQ